MEYPRVPLPPHDDIEPFIKLVRRLGLEPRVSAFRAQRVARITPSPNRISELALREGFQPPTLPLTGDRSEH